LIRINNKMQKETLCLYERVEPQTSLPSQFCGIKKVFLKL
jgi:hypothetical protein